jgi:hypothetical protein
MPDVYAHVMNNTANAYSKLAEYKNTRSNIHMAIDHTRRLYHFTGIMMCCKLLHKMNNLGALTEYWQMLQEIIPT